MVRILLKKCEISLMGVCSCGEPGCEYESKWASTLLFNRRNKHSQIKPRKAAVHDIDVVYFPFDANGCDYEAKDAGSLKRHEANMHGFV